MDVFLTREAWLDVEALRVIKPKSSAWGFCLGHKRGYRFFVEKLFFAGNSGHLSPRHAESLRSLWDGRIIGFFGLKAGTGFKRSLLHPAFFGWLYLDIRMSTNGPGVQASVIEFDGSFNLSPISLESPEKGRRRE